MSLYIEQPNGIIFIEYPKNTTDIQVELALELMALNSHDTGDEEKIAKVKDILRGGVVEPPPAGQEWEVQYDGVRVRDGVWGNDTWKRLNRGDVVVAIEKVDGQDKDSDWLRYAGGWICSRIGATHLAKRV